MKHSIKREQSHARMSFVECENQRSLAEGESNVRATLKHMKLSFHLILTLATMLTMAQTAWAATVKETRTETWELNGGASGATTLENSLTLLNGNGKRLYYYNTIQDGENCISQNTLFNSNITSFRGDIIKNKGEIIFSNLEGTVTKVELNQFRFQNSGLQMYIGRDKANTSTLLHLQGNNSDYDFPASDNTVYTSATFEGNLEVSQSNPLKILFAAVGEYLNADFRFQNGSITVTYEVEVEVPDPDDPGHTFSFNANGNTLTATCTETATYHHCNLGNGRKSTLTLTADDCPYTGTSHNASYNLGDFIEETGLTVTSSGIKYVNKTTGEERTKGPYEKGEYTACVTITIGGTEYTLTKDFNIVEGYRVNNNYSQFSVSPTSALEGDEITITYTQQMDESLDGLTLKGATSGNNIAYTQSGNTYTFTMPAEDVNLNATITYPLNENDFTQSGDTYTIKTAEGWNYFCQRLEVDGDLNGFSGKTVMLDDNITVTTMAGSTTRPFKGMFDGDGHTLTFNYTADMPNCAPFHITNGATIRNLHATGQIDGGIWHYMGGLVGSASGNLTIENCLVSTQISSTINGEAEHGGFVGLLSSQYNQCHITGCVFDGLICNPEYSGTTYGCGGFVGCFSEYGYAILEDCLFLHGQYDNNGGKCELKWGNNNDQNSTFFHRSNGYGEGTLINCFYVGTHGLKQGSPAVESATAPANFAHFGTPTDHRFMQTYGHTMVFNNKYYTPTYGDLVEHYDYSGVKSYIIEYDDAPLGIPAITSPLWTESLRYNRSFTAGKPMTVMLPFNFTRNRITLAGTNENPSGKFYEFKGIHLDPQTSKWVAVMIEAGETLSNEVVENTLQANHPYLYVPNESTKHWAMYVSGGINIFTEGNEGGTKETEYDGFEMRGTYTEKVWEENDPEIGKAYLIGDGGELIPVTAGTKIRPTECYIIQTKKRMDGKDITVSIPAVEWTGSKVAFDASTVKVWDGTTLLTQTTDYTVTAPTGTLQDTGDYPVTITGAGEYIGTKEAMFTIKGAPITIKNEANEDVQSVDNAYTITTDQRGGATLTLVTPEPTTPETPPTIVTVDIPTPVVVDHVDLDRIFEAGKACTLYLPFSIGVDKLAGGTFNTFVGVNTAVTPWEVQYSPVTTGKIAANTPYIFIPDGSNGGKIVVNNGEEKVTVCTANQHTTENGQWDFIGTYERIMWTHNTSDPEYTAAREAEIGSIYGFAAEEKSGATVGQFVKVTNNVWINPMRAYLKNSGGVAAPGLNGEAPTTELPEAMKVVIVEGSETTSLTPNPSPWGEGSGYWYTLEGQKLNGKPAKKGLYIHNGRKEVVK